MKLLQDANHLIAASRGSCRSERVAIYEDLVDNYLPGIIEFYRNVLSNKELLGEHYRSIKTTQRNIKIGTVFAVVASFASILGFFEITISDIWSKEDSARLDTPLEDAIEDFEAEVPGTVGPSPPLPEHSTYIQRPWGMLRIGPVLVRAGIQTAENARCRCLLELDCSDQAQKVIPRFENDLLVYVFLWRNHPVAACALSVPEVVGGS